MDRVLVIDDDVELCELLMEYMAPEGFEVSAAYDGREGLERALSKPYSLIVLDVMLPGLNGFEVLQRIRSRSSMPVLMLTARGEDVDRIVGLEMGADDYLPKPFNPRELVARVRAILRRTRPDTEEASAITGPERIVVDDVELDMPTRVARLKGEPVELTSVEFSLLEVLLRSAGHVVTREELTNEVLGRPLSAYDRSIDVHVSNLRRKLGHGKGGMERIKTVRGAGYLYVRPPQPLREET